MNRWESKSEMVEAIKGGKSVVCDRYAYSGVAYSAAKGLDFEWCKNADQGLMQPDIVFYLNANVEDTEKRGGFGEERFEKTDFQKKVQSQFTRFKEQHSG